MSWITKSATFLLGVQPALALAQFNSSTTCTQECQAAAMLTSTWENEQRAIPNDPFYTVPSNFSHDLSPGVLLAVERHTNLSNYVVPSSLTMSRLLYTTTDLNGTVQPASAYVLWPYVRRSDDDGFVAWAHGTSGVLPGCGPSNYKALQYHFMVPFALATQGIPVVAPDYAGLGIGALPDATEVLHAYMAAPAQANDLANAVIAARAAFPDRLAPEGRFVTMGHSQGGGVAWAFAQRQVEKPVPGYRGTLAFAPSVNIISILTKALDDFAQGIVTARSALALTLQSKVIAGITAVYPDFDYKGFSDITRDRWFNVLKPANGCLPTDGVVLGTIPLANLTDPSWVRDPVVEEFAERTAIGKKVAGPLFIITGELDTPVPLNSVDEAFDATCDLLAASNTSEELEMVTFSGANHFPVIQASQSVWMDWVKDRLFATGTGTGKVKARSTPTCKKSVVEGLDTENTAQSITPNWLVTAAGPSEGWKYSW